LPLPAPPKDVKAPEPVKQTSMPKEPEKLAPKVLEAKIPVPEKQPDTAQEKLKKHEDASRHTPDRKSAARSGKKHEKLAHAAKQHERDRHRATEARKRQIEADKSRPRYYRAGEQPPNAPGLRVQQTPERLPDARFTDIWNDRR
jgi:hypothetical protein